jgi:hypothetical protein
MPVQLIVSEGVLSADAEKVTFKKLTDLLLKLHGLSGNGFMTPNIIGEVVVVPKGRSFVGGEPADIAIFELKVPSFVLPTKELKDAWVSEGTAIIEEAAEGRIGSERIFANVVHAVEGAWGIAGVAYDNAGLGAAIAMKSAA